MSQIPEPAELEAQIQALIKQAGDRLRQHCDGAANRDLVPTPQGAAPSIQPGAELPGDDAAKVENGR